MLSSSGSLSEHQPGQWLQHLEFHSFQDCGREYSRISASSENQLMGQSVMLKVTMNKLCARLFIIIFMMFTRKSEYIPTVTNFASILANYFYFLRKITALRPSVLNFRGRLVKF